MGFLFAIWRRLFGSGYSRPILCATCLLSVFLWEWLVKDKVWYIAGIIAGLIYIFWAKGHFYYFLCGTESDEYIDEQEAKGRKPAMNWLVKPVNKWLGFKARSKQYCFVGMFLRYFLWSLPVALFVGWQFAICGFVVPFIYNAMFWVDFPQSKISKGPSGYAEFFTGLIIGWALL